MILEVVLVWYVPPNFKKVTEFFKNLKRELSAQLLHSFVNYPVFKVKENNIKILCYPEESHIYVCTLEFR
jgi:hypothetical protein